MKLLRISCILVFFIFVMSSIAHASSMTINGYSASKIMSNGYFDREEFKGVNTTYKSDIKELSSGETSTSSSIDDIVGVKVTPNPYKPDETTTYPFTLKAKGSISVRPDYGNIGLYVSGSVQDSPQSYTYTDYNNYSRLVKTTSAAYNESYGHVTWNDTIKILSSTFADGTPVSVRVTTTLEGSLFGTSFGYGSKARAVGLFGLYGILGTAYNYDTGYLELATDGTQITQTGPITITDILTLTVGSNYGMIGDLSGEYSVYAGWGRDISGDPWHVQQANGYANIWNTQAVHLDILTPGAYAETESGTDYSTKLGDVNRDRFIDIKDAILTLQVLSGMTPVETIYKDADINKDDQLGIAEAIYILQKVAGMR